MFMGPYEAGGDWSDQGIVGVDRFVQRAYDLFVKFDGVLGKASTPEKFEIASLSDEEKSVYRKINQTLNKYNEEIQHFRFNTAVAALMELLNELTKNLEKCNPSLQTYTLERFATLLSPIAPHLGEECWKIIGNDKSIFEAPKWFTVDEAALSVDAVNIAVQVNGKLRATIPVPVDSAQAFLKEVAFNDDHIKKHTDGKTIVKEIFVKNKIYNIVVK
jgi:leucyl-tRNA synthetase